jgi:phosphoserine/homoserine phosphotransferase
MSMTNAPPPVLASDLEGIFLPEIWIAFADATGIPELRLTTRDVADYDQLMRRRLAILARHGLRLPDIQAVIASMDLLPGAAGFLDWVRPQLPLIVVTDSYYEFVAPFMPKLGYVTLFAHRLEVAPDGAITGYRLRVHDNKRRTVLALRDLGFRTMAVGDSFNDLAMLQAADRGVLFQPPAALAAAHPELAVTTAYAELRELVDGFVQACEVAVR